MLLGWRSVKKSSCVAQLERPVCFLTNTHILHARTAYVDHPPPHPRRHLLRLWLSTPENEGGWALPFHDSNEKKRGGIQVNNTAPRAPLDAE
ncbi:hypothetical protein HYQ44_014033 [Verticillium longisporum]|nr:hypothetical protein HYQ44_014033 [Verticillium longisporum]